MQRLASTPLSTQHPEMLGLFQQFGMIKQLLQISHLPSTVNLLAIPNIKGDVIEWQTDLQGQPAAVEDKDIPPLVRQKLEGRLALLSEFFERSEQQQSIPAELVASMRKLRAVLHNKTYQVYIVNNEPVLLTLSTIAPQIVSAAEPAKRIGFWRHIWWVLLVLLLILLLCWWYVCRFNPQPWVCDKLCLREPLFSELVGSSDSEPPSLTLPVADEVSKAPSTTEPVQPVEPIVEEIPTPPSVEEEPEIIEPSVEETPMIPPLTDQAQFIEPTPIVDSRPAPGDEITSITPPPPTNTAPKIAEPPAEPVCKEVPELGEAPEMVIIFDNSMSMLTLIDGNFNSPPTRLDIAKKATLSIIDKINPNIEIGFVALSYCPSDNLGYYGLADRPALKDIVNTLYPDSYTSIGGGTALYDGIQNAAEMVDGVNREALILIVSDGYDTCSGNKNICILATQLASLKPKLKINVVDIGDTKAANCVAHATGGEVFSANNSQQVIDFIQNASKPMMGKKCF